MNRGLIWCLAALGVAAIFSPAERARAADAAPTGVWLDQSGRAGIEITPCADKLCGKIVWLKEPLNAEGKPKMDIHNSNPALRDRLVCGLPLLGDFVADGPDEWTGGYIYDPAGGSTYKSNMALAPDGTLHVRGYVGISLFGRSQTWTRPSAPLPPCAQAHT